ncbi:MAG: hypothetical protein ACRCX2_16370 [Paraclostridium sp.]
MKIIAYELHVETYHSLGAIFTALKNKGLDVDLKLFEHHTRLCVKSSNATYEFEIKLYEEYDGYKVYEIKAFGEVELNYLKEMLKTV